MLPGLGFSEIVVLAVIALLVIGPKDLPLVLRKLGRWMARLRGMAQEFRSGFDELARQAELDELKREVDALRRHSSFGGLVDEITRPVDMTPIRAPEAGVGRAVLARPAHETDAEPAVTPTPSHAGAADHTSDDPEPELPFDAPAAGHAPTGAPG